MNLLPSHLSRIWLRSLAFAFLVAATTPAAWAQAVRVLPEGQLPNDKRLGELKNLDGYFPFVPPASREAWAKRAERVRRQVLVATGLWPMPEKTAPNAVIHGKIDRDDYTVEKVYFESFPGHFVTGNLYRPKGGSGKHPAVLNPHGHWADGRFHDMGEKQLRMEIVNGAERFEVGGRSPLQSKCVQLARMGCVVFQYDMVGYADSIQLAHRPGPRAAMNTPENWGYFSPQAELRMENMMGLQTYNSIRSLDFLSGLPDVDPQRIGVTGASGGGTQTFMLCAIDPRPATAFPAVMVSTAMQGGCTCENACYLRVDSGNIELAALFAPKPLGMTAADDWTKEIATKGLPELKQLYAMLGVPDRVMAKPLVQFGHNYNYVSREVMYHWFNKQLKIGLPEPIVEEDYRPLTIPEMSVWDQQHPKPPAGDDYERSLLRWITEDSKRQIAALKPTDANSLAEYRRVVGGAVDVMIGRGLPEQGAVTQETDERDCGDYVEMKGLIRYAADGEEIPAIAWAPKNWNKRVVIWIHEDGKAGLANADGSPKAEVRKLLSGGAAVVGVDLLYQGEFLAHGPMAKARNIKGSKEEWGNYVAYTFGYNHPLFSQRVHDILSVVAAVRDNGQKPEKIDLVGFGQAGAWVAAARAQAGEAIDRAAIDTAGFRFAKLTAVDDVNFLPGGAKYDDLPGMLALAAPGALWIAGEGAEPPPVVAAAYKAAKAGERVTCFAGDKDKAAAAIEWLLK
ncbi:MAG: acetylxylan esterase family protein [Pirellulales bacterium]